MYDIRYDFGCIRIGGCSALDESIIPLVRRSLSIVRNDYIISYTSLVLKSSRFIKTDNNNKHLETIHNQTNTKELLCWTITIRGIRATSLLVFLSMQFPVPLGRTTTVTSKIAWRVKREPFRTRKGSWVVTSAPRGNGPRVHMRPPSLTAKVPDIFYHLIASIWYMIFLANIRENYITYIDTSLVSCCFIFCFCS